MGVWKALKNVNGRGGVRYREHATRKHGAVPDRYYALSYWYRGRMINEGIGWASGGWKPSKCFEILDQLKQNQKTGQGPCTLAEMRKQFENQKAETEKQRIADNKKNISFKEFFDTVFFPAVKTRWKPQTSIKAEQHVKLWINPVTGETPLKDLSLEHIERIRSNLSEKGRSPRTQQYVFRTFSMVWNAALDYEIVNRKCPTKNGSFRLPKIDNERQRYLTHAEEQKLLSQLLIKSIKTHNMAVVSLDSGLRFGEISALTWGCVDTENGALWVLNTKGKTDRKVPITDRLKDIFQSLGRGKPNELIFPTRTGTRLKEPPATFKQVANDLGLNIGVDKKMRVTFHTLRHTYASRLVQAGVDLFRVQRLLGHSTPVMTARYSKLADADLRSAVEQMQRNGKADTGGKVIRLRRVK